MALTFIQRADNNSTTSPLTVSFGSNVAAGNLLVLGIMTGDIGSVITSISDTRGNTYVNRATASGTDAITVFQAIYDCVSVGSGANTVTVAVNFIANFLELVVWEFHTTTGTWTFDQGKFSHGTATVATSGSVTTTQANEVMVGHGAIFGTPGVYASGWTGTNTAIGNASAYNIVSSAGPNAFTNNQGSSVRYGANIATYYASGGATPVNATVAIAAKAVSGIIANAFKTIDATFVCHAGAAGTFTGLFGLFATLIIRGRATSASFTGFTLKDAIDRISGTATLTLNPKITHNATVAIQGTASGQFNPFSAPTFINASVHIFAFAANNIALAPISGSARLRLNASFPIAQITINGRATLTLNPLLTHNATLAIKGTAKLISTGSLATGGGNPIFATVVIHGSAAFSSSIFLTHNASVLIEAGNFAGLTPLINTIVFRGHAALTLNAKVTHSATVAIQGRATNQFNALVTGGAVVFINAAVLIRGRASLSVSIPPTIIIGSVALSATASLSGSSVSIPQVNATVNILGRAIPSLFGFVQGGVFQNAVVNIAGRASLRPNTQLVISASVGIHGSAALILYPGDIIRATVNIAGRARFIPQTPHQPLVWISGNTLQYKVWQYNLETMQRTLGTSWSITSTGVSFQSVAVELEETTAGWGS